MSKVRPLYPNLDDNRWNVIHATINYLQTDPLVQTDLVDDFFSRRLRRLLIQRIDQMLDETTQIARTQTEKFGSPIPPQRA
jgi:hypothetical protein